MKILLLSHSEPRWPGDGYQLRLYYLGKYLASRHVVGLIYYSNGQNNKQEIPDFFHPILRMDRPQPRVVSSRPLSKLFALKNWPDVSAYYDSRVIKNIQRLVEEHNFDVIWASGWRMPLLVKWSDCGIPVLGDFIDEDIGEGVRRLLQIQTPQSFIRNLKRLIHSYFYEKRYFALADLCHLVSESEANLLRKLFPSLQVASVANGVDLTYFQVQTEKEEEECTIVFEGDMSFENNQDAVAWFVKKVFPIVRGHFPEAVFRIVGRNPTPKVLSLKSDHVQVTGAVPDVRPYIGKATIMVCPLLNGAGVKNKILQSWAMAKAMVATPVACMGLQAEHNENILVHKSAKDFANGVCELLRNNQKRKSIGACARDTVTKFYRWEVKGKEFEKLLMSLCRQNASKS